jgi:hypothetical protein
MRRPSGPYGEIDRDEWNVVNFVNDGGELISVGMRKGSGGGRLRRLRTTARLRHVHLMLTTRTKKELLVERRKNDQSRSVVVLGEADEQVALLVTVDD